MSAAFLLRMVLVFCTYHSLPLSDHFERFGAEMGWTARSLALGRGFSSPFFPQTGPTALVPPLFPLLLAGIFKVFGVYTQQSALAVLLVNSALSSMTCAVLFLGLRRRLGTRTATAAAWLWALYPYAVYYSAVYLWDCALTSFLFAACFFVAWNTLPYAHAAVWAGWGALAGLAVLSNPSILTLLPALLGWAAWQRGRAGLPVLRRAVVALALLGAVIAPWCIRNYRTFHQPVLIRDGFWGEFYAGNNGDTSHSNPGWTHPASNPAEMRRYQQLGELAYMAEKRILAMHHVERYPEAFVQVSLRRVVRFWTGYWSFSRAYLQDEALDVPNVPLCLLLSALMGAGMVALWRRAAGTAAPFAAVLLLFPLPYYLTHASIDYRQPIEPEIVALVAFGAHRLVTRWNSRRVAEREWRAAANEAMLAPR